MPLSLVLITCNAGRALADCLASVNFVDEIIVVDSGSTDNTREIAERFGARFVTQDWLGFGPQKQFAVSCARNDWILSLDADERVPPELAQSILSLWQNGKTPDAVAYALCRRNRFCGRWLRHGEGYPDWIVRLFDRRHARWSDDAVHEKIIIDHGQAGRLRGDLLHESVETIETYINKQNRYTTIQAEKMFAEGKRTHPGRMFFSPLSRFFRFYILKGGFLDGGAGFAHIAIGAWASFLKYAKLYALQNNPEPHDIPPMDKSS